MTVRISFTVFDDLSKISGFSNHEEQYFHVRRIHTYLSPTTRESICAHLTFEDGMELTIPNCTSVITGDY